jgi:hypothetical protein
LIPRNDADTSADTITMPREDYNELLNDVAKLTAKLKKLEIKVQKFDNINKKN